MNLYLNGLTKLLPERYIHSYITNPDGSICILTCVPFLLKLLGDPGVVAFDKDITYKCVEGEMNEWELTIFAKVVLHAASVIRAYINRASADFFEQVFDELQRVKLLITGKPMPLKRFVSGGNLLFMNADMDTAQIIGICRSIMKHNVPEYSGIPNDTPPEKVALEFIKIRWRHSKEPVHDFRSLVSEADHARLLNFVHIDSKETLDSFSAFVQDLSVKKMQDWWAQKEIPEWIIPCLVKSLSLNPAEVWDNTPSTTNTNEAQHQWTNSLTGIKLLLVEGLESLINPTVHSNTAQKARDSREQTEERKQLEGQLAEQLEGHCQSSARTKDINERLKVAKGASKKGKSSGSSVILSASSSGRVKTATVTSTHNLSSRKSDHAPAVGTALVNMTQPQSRAAHILLH
ncbi:hypothetical protein B0H10DRAFT_1950764 [Mycena sp. CBHHK59/15]|nr:hypothetical protein B0H10DRAFT_1950764 [Mycena sp. CBHHK59/15]